MKTEGMKVGSMHPTQKWNPLELILIRCNLDAGRFRLENRLNEMLESGETVTDSQRKYTEELMETLSSAMIALQDLEGERNIANHTSLLERIAHTKTMLRLEEAEKQIDKLKQEGEHLRISLAKFMR